MDHFLFTQVCRQCKQFYKTFRINLSNFDDSGFCQIPNQEIFQNFSFTCECSFLLNILDFEKICNPPTVRYMRKQGEFNRQIEETIKNLLSIQIEKLNLIKN